MGTARRRAAGRRAAGAVRSRLRTLVLVLAVAGLAAGCEVRTDIGIDVAEDGSGSVAVSIGLDDDAHRQAHFRTDDLEATGWAVSGPEERDGLRWYRAEKRFATVEAAGTVLAELAGADGPLRDFRLTRERPFARTRFTFAGTVDLSRGPESFSDPELAELLDGQPLGQDVTEIEQQLGQSLDRVFRFRIAVRLPGEVSSNAPGQVGNGAVWEPGFSDDGAVELRASSQLWRPAPLLWSAAALVAVVAAVVLAVSIGVRARRRHGRRTPAPEPGAPA